MPDTPRRDDTPDWETELGLGKHDLFLRRVADRLDARAEQAYAKKMAAAEAIETTFDAVINELAEDAVDMAEEAKRQAMPPQELDRYEGLPDDERIARVAIEKAQLQTHAYDIFTERYGDLLMAAPTAYVAEESYIRAQLRMGNLAEARRVAELNLGYDNSKLEGFDADINARAMQNFRLYIALVDCLTRIEIKGVPTDVIVLLQTYAQQIRDEADEAAPTPLDDRYPIVAAAETAMRFLRTYPHHDARRELLYQLALDCLHEAEERHPAAASLIKRAVCRERQLAHAHQHTTRLCGPSALTGALQYISET